MGVSLTAMMMLSRMVERQRGMQEAGVKEVHDRSVLLLLSATGTMSRPRVG